MQIKCYNKFSIILWRFMKRLLIASILIVIPVKAFASWLLTDREKYFDLMFQTTMKYQTYDELFTVKEVVSHIHCMRKFYEQNYTFEEFEHKFYNGNNNDIDEFHKVEETCVNQLLNSPKNINI